MMVYKRVPWKWIKNIKTNNIVNLIIEYYAM